MGFCCEKAHLISPRRSNKALHLGDYAKYVERFQSLYGPKNVMVVDGDNFVKRPWVEIERLEKFAGIKHEINKDR